MTGASEPIKVFLVDDHEIVRIGVRDLVEAEADMTVVGEAGDTATAMHLLDTCDTDVAVIDIRLGEESGIATCRQILGRKPEVACVMLTSFDDDQALLDAAEAGASGFLLKQVRSNEIVETIRKVSQGAQLLDDAVVRLTENRLRGEEAGQLAQLTGQERRVFDLIGDGKTNRQIAEELFVAEKTIKNYVTSMLAKLQLTRRTEAAAMAARIVERERRRFS